jgi:hypothetical protein
MGRAGRVNVKRKEVEIATGIKIHASHKFEKFPVGIHRAHFQRLNGLASFGNQIELGGLCCAGGERRLKRCRSSRHRLSLNPEQPFVTRTAAFLHKLDADEINITLSLGLDPISTCGGNLRVPLSRFRARSLSKSDRNLIP